MTTRQLQLAVVLPFLFLTTASFACSTPSDSVVAPVDELIARSSRIVLVRVDTAARHDSNTATPASDIRIDEAAERRRATEESHDDDRTFVTLPMVTMTVVENLKGSGPKRMSRPVTSTDALDEDFSGHTAASFWDQAVVGRIRLDDQCQPVVSYEEGGRYLVFVGPLHVKAAERIESDDDAWLAYVREQLAK